VESPNEVVFKERRFLGAEGLTLSVDAGGRPTAPAVVLLHGGGQTRHSWVGAARELVSKDFFVLSIDARGHGDSDWSPEGHYSLESQAADLRAVLKTLPGRPALVGASMGGATALYAVGSSSEPIASALVLVDIVPRVDPEGAARIHRFMGANPDGFATLDEAAAAVAAYNPHRIRQPPDYSGLMKNLRRHSDGRLHWHWDPKIIRRPYRLEPPEMIDSLLAACGGVRIPALLICGMHSDVVDQAGIDELQRHLPQLEVCSIAGAGHMVAGDANDAFNRAMIDFLQRCRVPV
jgi:pimeloyl-ACP methyl ester carboxylesterase